jgi:hypothetical protein
MTDSKTFDIGEMIEIGLELSRRRDLFPLPLYTGVTSSKLPIICDWTIVKALEIFNKITKFAHIRVD